MSQKLPTHISEPALIENPFWAFSVQVYGHDAVKNACLTLQDRFGADVNILLFLCWRSSLGLPSPTADKIQEMIAAITDLNRDVIAPLRTVRTTLPGMDVPGAPETRKKVLEAELSAEQMAQAVLFRNFPSPHPPMSTGILNSGNRGEAVLPALVLYFRTLGTDDAALDEARPLLSELAKRTVSTIQK